MNRKPFTKLFNVLGAAVCALIASGTLALLPAYADSTIIVDTFADVINTNGDCSLREAIIAANDNSTVDGCMAGSGDDRVVLAAGIYTLTLVGAEEQGALTGDLDITPEEGLTLQGAGRVTTTIDAGGIDRAFEVINPLARVTISDLTIQNGRAISGEDSGAIKNLGYLTLTHLIIQNNSVEGESSAAVGGAICNGCGLGAGHLLVHNSIIRHNRAQRAGGIFSNAYVTITQSALISNSAMAGGALINIASSGGRATIVNSTISGNVASNNSGAIAQSAGTLVITNSTIASNTAPLGGGIAAGGGDAYLHNTIFAGNANTNCYVLSGITITSNGHNLSSDASCMLTASGDLTTTAPKYLPLGYYGGATPTHKLSFLSPAIDAGSNAQCPATDQRDVTRPQAATCDIGAYERATDELPHFFYLPLMRKDASDAG